MTSQVRNLIITGVVAVLATAGAYAAFTRPGPTSASVFEVRAIDAQGHPVAGAEVWLENGHDDAQQVGVTDSFGIWRRNMKLPEGIEARFNFRKKFSARRSGGVMRDLTASKSFQTGKAGQKRADIHKGSVKLEPSRI